MGIPQFTDTTAQVAEQIQTQTTVIENLVTQLQNTDIVNLTNSINNIKMNYDFLERQIVSNVNITSLNYQTILDVTGKGILSLAVLNSITFNDTVSIKISIDNVVVAEYSQTSNSAPYYSTVGIYDIDTLSLNNNSAYFNFVLNPSIKLFPMITNPTFPNSSLQSSTSYYNPLALFSKFGIKFNSKLKIEVKNSRLTTTDVSVYIKYCIL